ncbi:sensor histidine kinase [Cellulomonas alba]|uniref:histidine kinase n=1 Tax=Cellulomonas alba TaxID=3053467 RepID=A0ABT7SGU3_9CELL|nr:ATP-binding protein [Cellulomonas alba]MDM7855418.1 ATP-binding protein [Cellulomonas alba]
MTSSQSEPRARRSTGRAVNDPSAATSRGDDREDQVILLRSTLIVASGYALGAALQGAYIYSQFVTGWSSASLAQRLGANLIGVLALVVTLYLMRLHRETRAVVLAGGAVVAAAIAAAARYGAQLLIGVYDDPTPDETWGEVAGGFVIVLISTGIGIWSVHSRRAARSRIRAAEREAVHIEVAVRALEQEEVRVRRAVAEGLHGTLQQKLVLVEARLAALQQHVEAGDVDAEDVDDLRWVRAELDEARVIDVREMSRLLYPDRLELGLVPAVRALLGRIPASIATRLSVAPRVRELDDPAAGSLTTSERLLAARIVEEGVTNSLKHGPAASIEVSLDAVDGVLVVTVENDGALYDAALAGAASGTARLAQRVSLIGGTLTLSPGASRGARLEARLPLGIE